MAEKRYLARLYRPTHRKQRRIYKGKLIGCTETTFAMYADGDSLGSIDLSEDIVRDMSGEEPPDPQSPGLNLSQMDKVAAKLHIGYVNRTGQGDTWSDVVAKLDDNRLVQASIYIGVNHSCLLQARRARPGPPTGYEILVNDPLDKNEKWVDEDKVREEMKLFVTKNGGNGLWYAYGRQRPFIAAGA